MEADSFSSGVFTLDSGNVQAVETSATDPKVRMDSTGFFLTDAAGNRIAQVKALSGALDILASPTGVTTDQRSLRWLRQADGSVIARIGAGDNTTVGADRFLSLEGGDNTQANSRILLTAKAAGLNDGVILALTNSGTADATTHVDVTAGQHTRRIIGADGAGKTIGGNVHGATGGITTYTGDFSVARTGVGAYKVTPFVPFARAPVCVCTPQPAGIGIGMLATPAAASIVINAYNSGTLAAVDVDFGFIALGTLG